MINIALVEDLAQEQDYICSMLLEFEKKIKTKINISRFKNAKALLNALSENNSFDIFLLDIFLPDILGTDLAKEIRKSYSKNPIVFLTTSKDFALEAFSVKAAQYLLKPIDKSLFLETMSDCFQLIKDTNKKSIILKTENGDERIPIADIICTEAKGNYQHLHLTSYKTRKVRMTAQKLQEMLLEYPEMTSCGVSYTINIYYIRNLTKKVVELQSEHVIPIPRGAYEHLHEQYFDFY